MVSRDSLKPLIPKLVTGSVVMVAVLCAYMLYHKTQSSPWTRDGQVRADVVQIAPRVSGYLVEIAIEDNQAVRKGELLFQIDPEQYQLAVDQAEVALVQARQTVDQLEASVRAAEASLTQSQAAATSAKSQIDAAQASVESAIASVTEAESQVKSADAMVAKVRAQLAEAERESERARNLADNKAGSVQTAEAKAASVEAYQAQVNSSLAELQQAQAGVQRAKASQRQAEANLVIAKNGLAEAEAAVLTSSADLDQAKATLGESGDANYRIQSAKVQLEQAKLDLSWTRIEAPADGFISNMSLLDGTFVSAGTPFALFVDSASFHVEAYFQETKLRHIAPGDLAIVTLMGHRDQPLKAEVESIGYAINPPNLADTEGPSHLVPTIQPTFEWIRLAQRVPVRIRLLETPEDLHLVSGMTTSVSIRN